MSAEELFRKYYAVPNPQFNAYFESMSAASDRHPLADLIEAAAKAEAEGVDADVPKAVTEFEKL